MPAWKSLLCCSLLTGISLGFACTSAGYAIAEGEGESREGEGENAPGEGEDEPGEGEDEPGEGEDEPGEGEGETGEGEDEPGEGEGETGEGEDEPGEGEGESEVEIDPNAVADAACPRLVECEEQDDLGQCTAQLAPLLTRILEKDTAQCDEVAVLMADYYTCRADHIECDLADANHPCRETATAFITAVELGGYVCMGT